LGTCCDVYNSFLHWRRYDFDLFGNSPSYHEQKKTLPLWKKEHPELCNVQSQVLQDVCRRADLAYQSYFDRLADYKERKAKGCLKEAEKCPGPPRSKGKGVYDSITYTQATAFELAENSIAFSKLGCIKAVLHRTLPGIPKTCTICRHSGKWFASISCEVEAEFLPESKETVGVDVGLNHFAITSDEEFIDNPRFFREDEKDLARAQRKFDKVKNKRRSPQRRGAKRVLARKHERIRYRRHDFVHQVSRRLINRYSLIGVENLSVENMMARPEPKPDPENPGNFLPNGASRKAGLNKSIADAAWSMFRNVLTSKAAKAGRVVVNVDPAYTSQDCSGCGRRVPKTLKERWHTCPHPDCGLSIHRDINAARNILKRALLISVGLYRVAAKTA